ncbi:MAG: bifunctional methylenetetrahydrofolate dehydrogenase/methenyltetrahydrofolate cyclohydrolase FolD [Marinicaulis sp.]|nr:bifunctional methylenetetrahydrofolate dehydrogenase/methenyltetrahydrofolate cyclohydrolase FolD [Marinicaulis sp.]
MNDAQIIDGKAIAADLTDKLAVRTKVFVAKTGNAPCLAVVLVGDDPASAVYVRNKGKTAEKVGFKSIQKILPADTPEDKLIKIINDFNNDDGINGILVQLPLPDHIDEGKIIDLIAPEKDVDGFHPINVGRLGAGDFVNALIPCTPAGSVILAKSALGDNLSGMNAVIIGRSNIVGKPVAQLLLKENCTVTIAHSRTKDLPDVVRSADIVVAAVGRPEMIKGDWIKSGATVIDVGINRVDAPEKGDGKTKLVGDINFGEASQVAGAITPVPGGVGPMTIALLMENTFTAACRQHGLSIA